MIYAGFALGPAIGSLLIRATGQVLSVFFLAASIHAAYALFVLFVVPESLTTEQMQLSMETHNERLRGSHHDHPAGHVTQCINRIFQFLSPLTILMPSGKSGSREDWSLTLIGLVYGLLYIILVRCTLSVFRKPIHPLRRTPILWYNILPLLLVGVRRL